MEKKETQFRKFMARVDIQVSVMMFVCTLCATIITSLIYYNFTFQIMMLSLEERVYALYESVELLLDMDTFEVINSAEDMDSELYIEAKEMLLELKNGCGVMYLYTAKEDEEGNFIYIIDGLEADQDFRYPGDAIEEEIVGDMQLALSGEEVIPDSILHTDWGSIFVAYLPVHNSQGEILGVVGIEFDASTIYQSYLKILIYIPAIIIILSLVAAFISFSIFKRLSNPLYMDMATVDSPTGLKNRNAYEVDINNRMVRGLSENTGIIMLDINGLKAVNDRIGHNAGDDYIKLVAEHIKATKDKDMIAYRIGGDEFVLIVPNATEEKLREYINKCSESIKNQSSYLDMRCSVSCGYSIYDNRYDDDLEDTYHRADEAMYGDKKRQKEWKSR